MDGKSRAIAVLAVLVVLLAGAVAFLAGRLSADGDAAVPPAAKTEAQAAKQVEKPPSPPAEEDPSPPAKAAPAAPPEDPRTIPAAFHGEWNRIPAHCGTGLNDSALRIRPRSLHFYESRGDVTGVTRDGEHAIVVEARFEGEGERWTDRIRFALSSSGDALTVGEDQTRRRCR